MDFFTIKAELKASIHESSGGEVRYLFRTDPDWSYEDVKETGLICFIQQSEYFPNGEQEKEEERVYVPLEACTRAPHSVLKGILAEMVFNDLKARVRRRGSTVLSEHVMYMPNNPDTSGFFHRYTFDHILRGPWFVEDVSLTGNIETVLEDGTVLSVQFADSGVGTVYRNGEAAGEVSMYPGSREERKKGRKPLEDQMEFAYPAYGDSVEHASHRLAGPSSKPWYTDRYEWRPFFGHKPVDTIRGVDSILDILEAMKLYDRYYDKEGRSGLMTEKIEKALLKVDDEELSATPKADWKVIVMYFDPCNLFNQWLIVKGEKWNGDWILYGLVHLLEWEWGSVSLKQLEEARHHPGDHPLCSRILREVSVSGQRLEDVLKTHRGRPGWEELL